MVLAPIQHLLLGLAIITVFGSLPHGSKLWRIADTSDVNAFVLDYAIPPT